MIHAKCLPIIIIIIIIFEFSLVFLKLFLNLEIILDFKRSCKYVTETSHTPFLQFPLMLTFYIIMTQLSRLTIILVQHYELMIDCTRIALAFFTFFLLSLYLIQKISSEISLYILVTSP